MTTHKNTTVGKFAACTLTVAALSMGAADAGAVEWSDTSIGYRYGTQFAEPF
ncbi:outer envelope protein, partial [Ralstonia insidiosa]|nr:outer envelope protein [Ralstonia insidiosa]MBA9939457.1 outer envelope protein [Ralstonia insidiosa]